MPIPAGNTSPPGSRVSDQAAPLSAYRPDEAEPDVPAFESADYPPSRLSGLRNLLVSLGRRSLNQDNDVPEESDSDIEPRFERATVRPVYQDLPRSANGSPENGTTHLTAQPEFLRPKPGTEVEREKEKESVLPTPPRRDTPEGEEIQTLPSWRGQYRKKRYPPV